MDESESDVDQGEEFAPSSFFWVEAKELVVISSEEEDIQDPPATSSFVGNVVPEGASRVEGLHASSFEPDRWGNYNANPSFAAWASSAVVNFNTDVFAEEVRGEVLRRHPRESPREVVVEETGPREPGRVLQSDFRCIASPSSFDAASILREEFRRFDDARRIAPEYVSSGVPLSQADFSTRVNVPSASHSLMPDVGVREDIVRGVAPVGFPSSSGECLLSGDNLAHHFVAVG